MKYKKGTFIVIPNKEHLRGKPSEMQSIYFWLCEHADENGKCFPTKDKISLDAGCSHNTTDKYLKQLEDDGFVKITNRRRRGTNEFMSNLYQILIINLPPKVVPPIPNNGITPTTKNGVETVSSINSTHLIAPATAGDASIPFLKEIHNIEFSFENEMKRLSTSSWKPNKIIALFWTRKKWRFENEKQFKSAYKRQLKPAKELEGYNSEQLNRAMEYCEDNFSNLNWGLETLIKIMPKVINEK